MTVSQDSGLYKRLLRTKDNLRDVCEELGIELPEERDLECWQCSNCLFWRDISHFNTEEEIPICDFCENMHTLRF